jgi:hypothetical protein
MVLLFFDFLLRGVAAGQKGMTLVGEIDFQLLELNLADTNWMYHPDKRFRILPEGLHFRTSIRRHFER